MIPSVAHAEKGFRTRGGQVTYDARHHVDRVPGHQLNLTNPDESRSDVGTYLHGARLYILEARVDGKSAPGTLSAIVELPG